MMEERTRLWYAYIVQGKTRQWIASDLAPGDAAAARFDWSGIHLTSVRSADHPLFRAAYDRLWAEFGARGEMERESVIASRLQWDPARPLRGRALLYEMIVVRRGEEMIAVRDHTAILPSHPTGSEAAVVHLSHVLVERPMRGSGLANWLRALPLQCARECTTRAAIPARPITLVAEMEHAGSARAVMGRLRSYQRAGFSKIDPARICYAQPDFRSAAEIERDGLRPLSLALVIRRVGREHETEMTGAEVTEIVSALYDMFAVHVREDHMNPLWRLLESLPSAAERVALVLPQQ